MRRKLHKKLSQTETKRRILALVFFLLAYGVGILHLYTRNRIYPNTWLGHVNISGRTYPELNVLLDAHLEQSINMQVRDRIYKYTYTALGIDVDHDLVWQKSIVPGQQTFPYSLLGYLQALRNPARAISVPLTYSVDYSRYIDDTVFDFSSSTDHITVDAKEKTISYQDNEQRFTLDDGSLKGLLAYHFGETEPVLQPYLIKLNSSKKETVYTNNEQLKLMFSKPITVIVREQKKPITFLLTADEIKRITTVKVDPDTAVLSVSLDSTVFADIMSQYIKKLKLPPERQLAMKPAKDKMEHILTERMNGNVIDYLEASLDDGPNTTGDIAGKYIEVDISQQRMYLFDHGSISASYRISSGSEFPTPIGQFAIMNKAENAFSNIYNVWMPYWMGFSFNTEVNAMIGIHELPYAEADGERRQVASDQIGSPSTGGCIALDVGAAKEVFTFADVGTPVYIYN